MRELSFRPQSLPAAAYFGLAFGIIFVLSAIAALVVGEHGPFEIAVAILVLLLGGSLLQSAAYALWGRLHLQIDNDDWCVITWRLGRFSRTKRFPRPDVRSIRLRPPDPRDGFFASRTGKQVEVWIDRERRPLLLGGGFDLDAASLEAIVTFFGADVAPAATP